MEVSVVQALSDANKKTIVNICTATTARSQNMEGMACTELHCAGAAIAAIMIISC